jgi:hypothetical protein
MFPFPELNKRYEVKVSVDNKELEKDEMVP